MLASSGAEAVCLNGGGDIQLHGGPWRVGVSDPLHPGELVTVIEADEGLAVATSGPPNAAATSSTRTPAGPPPTASRR